MTPGLWQGVDGQLAILFLGESLAVFQEESNPCAYWLSKAHPPPCG